MSGTKRAFSFFLYFALVHMAIKFHKFIISLWDLSPCPIVQIILKRMINDYHITFFKCDNKLNYFWKR